MKIVTISLLLVSFLLLSTLQTEAKLLPQAKKSTQVLTKSSSSGIYITPRLRADRKALNVTFSNLQYAKSISYSLSYKSAGIDRGVMGTIDVQTNTLSRELLFGTCSKNVCTYHQNITDMKFEVTTELKSGKTTLKRYRIRI